MTLNQQSFDNAELDLATISEVANVNYSGDDTTNREGTTIATLLGQLKQIGYIPPVSYAGSIAFLISDTTKTIERSGVIYAPNPTDLPFTTTGTWGGDDEDKFFVIQGTNVSAGSITTTELAGIGDAKIYVGSGTGNVVAVDVSGAVTITNAGVVALTANSVDSDQYVDGSVDVIHIELLADGEFLTSDGIVNKKVTISGDVVIDNTGDAVIQASAVEESMLITALANKINQGNATNVYRARVDNTGTAAFNGTSPAGWSLTNFGSPARVRVTHGLATSNYDPNVTAINNSTQGFMATIYDIQPNYFEVLVHQNGIATSTDKDFTFTLTV